MLPLIPGQTYVIKNLETGTAVFYDNATRQLMGYPGAQTVWRAVHVDTRGPGWTLQDTASKAYMGYLGNHDDGTQVVGVDVPTIFDIWPVAGGPTDNMHSWVTINLPGTFQLLQLAIEYPVPGVALIVSTSSSPPSTLQQWNFESVRTSRSMAL